MQEWITLEFDGGSRGNPGPSGVGVVLSAQDGTPLVTLGRFIGHATNNVAEYRGLITALQQAQKLGAKKVIIRGDSELIIKQMKGEYKVRHPQLKPLYDQARQLLRGFEAHKIEHNLRHKNELADKLANLAMDRRADVTDANGRASPSTPPLSPKAPASKSGPATGPPLPIDLPSPLTPVVGTLFACARCTCVIRLEAPSGIRPHQLKPFVCQCGAKMYEARKSEPSQAATLQEQPAGKAHSDGDAEPA
jgi:ribonuclease HI